MTAWPTISDGELPRRRGELPEVTRGMPHQQASQNAPAELQEALLSRAAALEGVEVVPSSISVPGARALRLHPDLAGGPDAFMVGTEFAHLHPSYDGSLHVVLPPETAREVVATGWGDPHPLAGSRLSEGMVMVFGPRDPEELEVVWEILRASYLYARGEG